MIYLKSILAFVFFLVFEICFRRFFLKMSWNKIFSDFKLVRGRLIILGLFLLVVAPFIAVKILDKELN